MATPPRHCAWSLDRLRRAGGPSSPPTPPALARSFGPYVLPPRRATRRPRRLLVRETRRQVHDRAPLQLRRNVKYRAIHRGRPTVSAALPTVHRWRPHHH
jgi:hypothetical protein